jgi:hypothetical protein
MKYLLVVVVTAVISVVITLLLTRREQKPASTTPPLSRQPVQPRSSQRWLALKDESAKLDADFDAALRTNSTTPAEAAASLPAYTRYCSAQVDLISRQEALYREEHQGEDNPVLIEQREATVALCKASKELIEYTADPKNGFHRIGDENFANDPETYNRLFLAFRVACVRLVGANAAASAVEE